MNRRHVVDTRPLCSNCDQRFTNKRDLIHHKHTVHFDSHQKRTHSQYDDSYRKNHTYHNDSYFDNSYYNDSYYNYSNAVNNDTWHYVSGPRQNNRRPDSRYHGTHQTGRRNDRLWKGEGMVYQNSMPVYSQSKN